MTGSVALHGGREYVTGDEPFLRCLLDLAAARALPARDAAPPRVVRVAIVPTAAAGQRPELAGANGVAAFERVRGATGIDAEVDAEVVPVVDGPSAHDPTLAERLRAADLIDLPGGEPALVPSVLRGSPAWDAILAALGAGAVLAGSSAGAMGLCEWTWTPAGIVPGLGLVRGLVVIPHFDTVPAERWQRERERARIGAIGLLGLDEQTGIVSQDEPATWRVVGRGAATWLAAGGPKPVVAHDGDQITLDGTALTRP